MSPGDAPDDAMNLRVEVPGQKPRKFFGGSMAEAGA